ncbi:hypothetical protein LZ30DRAFT_783259 [Colletotrichum cereale]|nr:hypothetical protein LZ30DRAFT_783259 [Colletotrichum cereale]
MPAAFCPMAWLMPAIMSHETLHREPRGHALALVKDRADAARGHQRPDEEGDHAGAARDGGHEEGYLEPLGPDEEERVGDGPEDDEPEQLIGRRRGADAESIWYLGERRLLRDSSVGPASVASVTVRTTHFVNAIVEGDASRLAPVAVLRLCGPFSAATPAGADWPPRLRAVVCAHRGLVDGGLEIDGDLISQLDEDAVRREAEDVRAKGIRRVVVAGIFSPVDVVHRQEERAAEIVCAVHPAADVVLSRDVAHIGFIERENAAILNAAILPLARRTSRAFKRAVARLGLTCPVFVTQNDGTVLPAAAAARVPIRTLSSGPTNSMRGAAFLTRHLGREEAMMVVDIGGTATDVGLLLENGFPRPAAAYSEVAGVRTNLSRPDVKSIGLGGGSVVRKREDGGLAIGPQSVGYRIRPKALAFGGDVATVNIGDRALVERAGLRDDLPEFKANIKAMLERIIDTMKTSPEDIPVVLVGGGAVIAPDTLVRASRVIKPEWSGVANAIGAATARVSGVIDSIESAETKSSAEVIEELSQRAVDKAVENGAYIANKARIIIKAVGDFDFTRTGSADANSIFDEADEHTDESSLTDDRQMESSNDDTGSPPHAISYSKAYMDGYRPKIIDRQWHLSETDLDWITIGCYILGTGGGGSPYQHMLRLREMMRAGATVRIVSPLDLKDDDVVACGGGKGSPQVSIEKPYGDEIMKSQRELYAYLGTKPTAVIALEIGGGNGLQGLILGASTNLDVPTIDGDFMGRAGRDIKSWAVENTVSLSWRIGRAVAPARCTNTVDAFAEAVVEQVGGEGSARVLFRGKIVGVERVTRSGHAYGEVVIESGVPSEGAVEEILAIVPDLVCVIDAQNGEAIGTQEYRYGLLVVVVGITASEKRTSTARGIEIGGPKGFGMDDLEYVPLGKFKKPRSVIEEFGA